MEAPVPSLQVSDADGSGHTKRRRPALSCVECRKRKVKCDREKPCGPCTRTKSPTCTYRVGQRGVVARNPSPPTSAPTSQQSSGTSPRSYNQSAGFDALVNRYIAPGMFGPHGSVTLSHLPGPSPRAASDGKVDASSAILSLIERVQDLERRLAQGTNKSSLEETSLPVQRAASPAPGQFVKHKYYGESHWYNAIDPYAALGQPHPMMQPNPNRTEINRSSELYNLVAECKRMARVIKSARKSRLPVLAEIQSSFPPKEICDPLVEAYLRTYEGVFRVLHVPTFQKEYDLYWQNSASAAPTVVLKILLVCAIGVPFHTGEDKGRLLSSCGKWIQAAEAWLNAPHEKTRLNLTGLQIHILVLLARQNCNVDGDLIWIPAGALLRRAMHLGLHRDPSHFPKLSVFHAEMRRRLWATVLELTVQLSLDMGMPPMLSLRDFDTLPPSNVDDAKFRESMNSSLDPRPQTEYTQSSIQIALHKTVHLRLKITRMINNIRSDVSYDETLRMGSELAAACRADVQRFQGFLATQHGPTPFQVKLLDVLVRRFILCLHRPFFALAKTEPKHYYSRKICLDTSMLLLAPISRASQNGPATDHDWTLFTYYSVGVFKSVWSYSVTTIYLELLAQIEEQQRDPGPFPIPPVRPQEPFELVATLESVDTTPGPSSRNTAPKPLLDLLPQFHALRNALELGKQTTGARICSGETNAKGHVFAACCLARIDALVTGANPEEAVLKAARESMAQTAEMMRHAYHKEHGTDIDLSQCPPTIPESGALGPGIGGTAEKGDASVSGFEIMDWDSLLNEDMDLGFGFQESPEDWSFGGWDGGPSLGGA